MPTLFALPGTRSGENNFPAEIRPDPYTSVVIPVGTTSYASVFRMYWTDHNQGIDFTNNGTLWNLRASDTTVVLAGFYERHIVNTGLMVADAQNGSAYGIGISGGNQNSIIDNSGSIYAIANGNSTTVQSWDSSGTIRNSGLIAAYAPAASIGGVGGAVAVSMVNGGVLLNATGGQILAEGLDAAAVTYGRGSPFADTVIRNDGRIEALSTGTGRGVGISAGGLAVETVRFINSGLLRAVVAWSSYSTDQMYGPRAVDLLTNEASGQIVGRVETGPGADQLINHGLITGTVAMGDDNDLVDTTDGRIDGVVDLGWNDDLFKGSAFNDVVNGGRNADTLFGAGGDDLLLGGVGDDHLEGGQGNDGLYGEIGNDLIVTQGGDKAFGGDGDDVIQATDLSFAMISGGAGADVLRLACGAVKLDLAAVIASGRLDTIETIALDPNQQLAVRGGDAAALAGGTLRVTGAASDQVVLVGGWIEGAASVSGATTFRSFTLGSETVLVANGVVVQLAAQAPSGFTGLDAVAGGAAAPLAGSVPGGNLSDPVTIASGRYLQSDLIIDTGETWRATNVSAIVGYTLSAGLVNHGIIEMTSNAVGYANTAVQNDIAFITNDGVIRTSGNQTSYAINTRGSLHNTGLIQSDSTNEYAIAVQVGGSLTHLEFENAGTISAHSALSAVAVQVANSAAGDGPVGTNSGVIEAIGGAGTVALKFITAGTFNNSATITAANTAGLGVTDATAVLLWNDGSNFSPSPLINRIVNSGHISGTTAIFSQTGYDEIDNSGQIDGLIVLGTGNDVVDNSGIINGRISLGDGVDGYFGSNARAAVSVDGGDGNDGLFGGAFADTIEGGSGDDTLIGGGGADHLVGGAGADRFVYLGAQDSMASQADTIQDFETGVDKLDLSALAPTSVDLAASGGITTVTAHTAAGDLVIKVTGTVAMSDIDLVARAGTAAGDVLVGTAGDDRIDGGAGSDIMVGLAGNDTYLVDNANDRVIERAGGGVDQIISSVSVQLPDFVENGTLTAPAVLMGNAENNVLHGSAGNDQLYGLDGNDVLIGGGGADSLFGSAGSDTFIYLDVNDSTAAAQDSIGAFEYGVDKIDLTALDVRAIDIARVQNMFESYEQVTVTTSHGTMMIEVAISNVVTSGLQLSDFILSGPLSPLYHVANDYNGDGHSDVLLRNATTGVITQWLSNGPDGTFTTDGNPSYALPSEWQIVAHGDFDGDGRTDLIFQTPQGSTIEWLGRAGNGFAWNSAATYQVGSNSTVAGAGDFNGDGRDDLAIHNHDGTYTTWYGKIDGTFDTEGKATYQLPTDWNLVATGDFDGDGRTDLLLRNSVGTIIEWLGQANNSFAFNPTAVYSLDNTWKIAVTGAISGDIRDDLVLRNDNGTITEWLGDDGGRFFANGISYALPANWTVAASADYNGDGHADLLIRSGDGSVIEWLGRVDGGFTWNEQATNSLELNWHAF